MVIISPALNDKSPGCIALNGYSARHCFAVEERLIDFWRYGVPLKIVSFDDSNFSGIVTFNKEEQFSKAPSPIFVTPSGMVMEVKEEQFQNAPFSIAVTLFGIVTEVKEEQELNALLSIFVMLFGTLMEIKEEQ